MAQSGETEPQASLLEIACEQCWHIMTVEADKAGSPTRCASCGEFMIVPKERFGAGTVVGDFVVRKTLAEEDLGVMCLGHQLSLDRPCGLKFIHEHLCKDEEVVRNLMKEARLAANLNHPNIVQCYAVGMVDDIYYYATEHVEGKTLEQLLEANWKLQPGRALDLAMGICDALEYAWTRRRLVHRDIKPGNIMVTDENVAKLMDMGLARPPVNPEDAEADRDAQYYLCPEQIEDRAMDFHGEIYSLGAVLYHCITGQPPFRADSAEEVREQHLNAQPQDPDKIVSGLPQGLNLMLLRMLAKIPEQRYPDFSVLRRTMEEIRLLCLDNGGDVSSVPGLNTTRTPVPRAGVRLSRTGSTAVGDETALLDTNTSASQRIDVSPQPAGVRLSSITILLLSTVLGAIVGLLIYRQLDTGTVADGHLVRIVEAMPDPAGYDRGREEVTVANHDTVSVNLNGWRLRDADGGEQPLVGYIGPGERKTIVIEGQRLQLDNRGETIYLISDANQIVDSVNYAATQVSEGARIPFHQD